MPCSCIENVLSLFLTWPFPAEWAFDLVKSINGDKDYRVCMGYNRVLITVCHPHTNSTAAGFTLLLPELHNPQVSSNHSLYKNSTLSLKHYQKNICACKYVHNLHILFCGVSSLNTSLRLDTSLDLIIIIILVAHTFH